MTLRICTRRDLLARPLAPHEPAVVLEGSWGDDGATAPRWSLDDTIDGRFDWIDRQASDLAERLGTIAPASERPPLNISPAYLNALALRYYLVKLIRVAVFFREIRPLRPGQTVELVAAGHDRDYAEVIEQLCDAAGAECRVRWVRGKQPRPTAFPRNAPWRRWARRISRLFTPSMERSGAYRAVLCGNPRLLDPVCRQLLSRKCNVWWLYDRFALKSWFRWTGARQLVCDSSAGRENRLRVELPTRLECCGVNLTPPVARWLHQRVATHGVRHTHLIEQMDEHFRRVRPDVLVLDEDATPMARAAVAVGRRHGARSLVVQHGAPCCRFGFAPPAADRILVWGRSSQETLTSWAVDPEQIQITGASQIQSIKHTPYAVRPAFPIPLPSPDPPPRILLLTTVPPRDARPDAVSLNLNRRTYTEMLRMAFRTIAGINGAELIVKLHPRAPRDPVVRQVRAEFSKVHARIVRRRPMEQYVASADVVLSCGSSAGVEAALAGVPVIQLLPRGSKDFLPHEKWGMLGTACHDTELQQLLIEVLVNGWQPRVPGTDVFASLGDSAAKRIADEVISPSCAGIEDQPNTQPNSAESPPAAKVA